MSGKTILNISNISIDFLKIICTKIRNKISDTELTTKVFKLLINLYFSLFKISLGTSKFSITVSLKTF